MSISEGPQGDSARSRLHKASQVIIVSSVMFTFISYWRTAAIVLSDLGQHRVLHWRDCRAGDWPGRSVVHSGGDALQLRGAVRLHRECFAVRPWRRVPCDARSVGRIGRQGRRLGAAVRLRAHRPDQQRRCRAVHHGAGRGTERQLNFVPWVRTAGAVADCQSPSRSTSTARTCSGSTNPAARR